jgi:hypothetical protein
MFNIMVVYISTSRSVTSQSFSFESRATADEAAKCARKVSGVYVIKLYE